MSAVVKYTKDEINTGLTALATCNGSAAEAAKLLAEAGELVKRKKWTNVQLSYLKKTHPEEYIRLATDVIPEIQQRMADNSAELAERYAGVERKILERMEKEVDEIPARDLAGAQRNIATSRAISVDKFQAVTGQGYKPPSDTRDAAEILKGLARDFKGVITVRAVEIEATPDKPESPDVLVDNVTERSDS